MLLALDARNASISVGAWREGGAAGPVRFRLGAGASRSADEWAYALDSMLRAGGVEPSLVDRVVLSCVVPSLSSRLLGACSKAFALEPLVVGPGVRNGLKIRTDSPSELGSDLVCDAVAARELMAARGLDGHPCVVVDFGSAIAFSALSASGEYLGASIAPGPELASLALSRGAALLPEARFEASTRAIGRNTADAMRSGLALGFAGLVDRVVERMAAELGEPCLVVGSGEEYGRLLEPVRGYLSFEPDLALEGLRAIAALNPAGAANPGGTGGDPRG
ncbi:MAG: type III pantothenate kinase [Spirochaetales bacterium]|nr:type III pantothenate kinase [Spirochaetales bacterium]